jgi:hypothetical protein
VAFLYGSTVSGIKPLVMESDDHRHLFSNNREGANIKITSVEVVKMNKMGFVIHAEEIPGTGVQNVFQAFLPGPEARGFSQSLKGMTQPNYPPVFSS